MPSLLNIGFTALYTKLYHSRIDEPFFEELSALSFDTYIPNTFRDIPLTILFFTNNLGPNTFQIKIIILKIGPMAFG